MPNARRVIARCGIAAALLLSAIVSQPELLHGRATPSLPLNGAIVRVSTESELQAAVQNLTSNTTILLAPGVYTLSSTVWVRGPLSGVAIRGDSNTSDDVVLVGQGMNHASYGLVPYGIAAGGNVDDVTIANLTIRDTYRQAVVFDPSVTRPHLFNVHVIDAGDGMVLSAAGADYRGVASGIIEFSTFEYTNGVRSLGTLAIDLRGVTGWIIRDNMFRNIVGPSRQLAGPAIAVHAMSRDTLTEENTFTNVSQGIAYGLGEQGGADHTGGFIRNNIFFRTSQQPGGAGIMINDSPGAWIVNNTLFVSGTYGTPIEYRYPGARDVVVANNLLDGRVWAGDGATAIESHNYEGATADMFMDASKGDLHLSAAAVGAIDRGVATEAVTQDIDGQIRPIGSGYDIGADEREGRGRVTAAATSSVSIHGHVYSANGTTMPGSIVTLSGSRSATATADPAGAFAFDGLAAGGSYTVTPTKSGYSFQPASAFYGSLGSNVSNVIFWGSTSSAAPLAPAPPAPAPPAPAPPAPPPPVTTPAPPVVVTPAPTASVQLTAPKNLNKYFAPAAVTITATGTNLTSVKFYANSSLIGTSGSQPYSVNWTAVQTGTYSLKAVGVDAKGLTVDSSPVQIVVEQPAPPTPPTVSISAPKGTDTFTAPATITINAGASSTSSTVSQVDFYAGATLIGSDTASPFATTWSNVPAGSYSLTAVATDKAGNATRSSAVNITVSAPNVPPPPPPVTSTPPIVSLTSPADGSAFTTPATVVVTADASSTSGTLATTSTTGVAKVEIYAGATLIGSDATAPFGVTWSNMAPGTYSLTAVATNTAGQSTRSAPVNVTIAGPVVVAPAPVGGGLVQPGNLVYQGSFRVPFGGTMKVPGTDRGFDYGGSAPAYNPVNNTLFLVSHVYDQQTAELNIPSSLGTGAVSSWPVATVRTPFTDVLEGQRSLVAVGQGDPTTMIGGQLVYGGELFVQPYVYYGDTNAKSHWRRSPDLNAQGTLQGPFAVGPMGSDFYTGYMGLIPPDWQSALGGPVLNGQCCLSIISRTSFGPSVSAMDPKQLGPTTVSASALVAYPSTHKTLGDWGTPGTNAYFNGATQIKGVVFPFGTSSVLFFGKHGLGNYCYGEGSACNDPEDGDKGDHAYPYAYYIWAYDAHDLAAVHSGQKQPWDIRPYAVWQLTLPAPSRAHRLGGVAYDPATGRLFISQQFVDGDSGDYPVVHVYVIR